MKLYPAGKVRWLRVVFCGRTLCDNMAILTGDDRYPSRELNAKGWRYERRPLKWGWCCPKCSQKER